MYTSSSIHPERAFSFLSGGVVSVCTVISLENEYYVLLPDKTKGEYVRESKAVLNAEMFLFELVLYSDFGLQNPMTLL